MTDGNTLSGGFYVDDISPVCLFADVNTVSSSITDTSYSFTGHAEGEFYYYVKGYNNAWAWGDYSCLERADVVVGIAETPDFEIRSTIPSLSISPNPFREITNLKFQIPSSKSQSTLGIYDVSGKIIRSFDLSSGFLPLASTISWDSRDDLGRRVPAGVYFVRFKTDDYQKTEKAVLLK